MKEYASSYNERWPNPCEYNREAMLPKIKPRSLEAMARYPTAYEVVAIVAGSEHRLGFTARRTKGALLRMAQAHGDRLAEMANLPEEFKIRYDGYSGMDFGGLLQVRFSGRTERTCRVLELENEEATP